jgi:UDP-N-acetylmuramoyl-L-alanyl-D-glutamate--2,6-diaminopimelate ligase
MKILKDILYRVGVNKVYGSTDVEINELVFDNRKVVNNDLFVAIKGTLTDGHKFIDSAIAKGAIVILCEKMPVLKVTTVTYVVVKDTKTALAIMAENYYDNPSENLQLIGVTGTNGKTTIATLLYWQFKKAGYKVGLISTVQILINEKVYATNHTTPDSVSLNCYLKLMVDNDVAYCFMEVSSHGIDQKRTEGLRFAGGIFTNLTHDHLDYHKSFDNYRDVKKSFFDQLPKSAFALINIDDKNGSYMLQNTKAKPFTYAIKTIADYKAKILENQFNGLLLSINNNEVWTKLIGTFNAYNLLAIYAASDILGLEQIENLRLISELESVSGRFQCITSDSNITAIIDYAHTPDALKNVLETINTIRTHKEQVITVVGCGGNRDKAKRPKMGHIASQLSDQVVFTSDNPRNEKAETIIDEMLSGVEPQNLKKIVSIVDRRQAIKTATKLSNRGDILLIAGKGHETYQEINGVRTNFDDYQIIKETFKEIQK